MALSASTGRMQPKTSDVYLRSGVQRLGLCFGALVREYDSD